MKRFVELPIPGGDSVHVSVDHIQAVGIAYEHKPSSVDPNQRVSVKIGTLVSIVGGQIVVSDSVPSVLERIEYASSEDA